MGLFVIHLSTWNPEIPMLSQPWYQPPSDNSPSVESLSFCPPLDVIINTVEVVCKAVRVCLLMMSLGYSALTSALCSKSPMSRPMDLGVTLLMEEEVLACILQTLKWLRSMKVS